MNSEPLINKKRPVTETSKNVGNAERMLSTAAGAALLGLSIRRKSTAGILLGAAGIAAIYRGVTGQCPLYKALNVSTTGNGKALKSIHVEETTTIHKPRAELYQFWRDLENLPRVMPRIKSVVRRPGNIWHWVAKGPFRQRIGWDVEIIKEVENELIEWQSLPNKQIVNAGSVRFEDDGAGATRVTLKYAFDLPEGRLGRVAGRFLGEDPNRQLIEDLNRLKTITEEATKRVTVPTGI